MTICTYQYECEFLLRWEFQLNELLVLSAIAAKEYWHHKRYCWASGWLCRTSMPRHRSYLLELRVRFYGVGRTVCCSVFISNRTTILIEKTLLWLLLLLNNILYQHVPYLSFERNVKKIKTSSFKPRYGGQCFVVKDVSAIFHRFQVAIVSAQLDSKGQMFLMASCTIEWNIEHACKKKRKLNNYTIILNQKALKVHYCVDYKLKGAEVTTWMTTRETSQRWSVK